MNEEKIRKEKYTDFALERKKYFKETLNRYGITVLEMNTSEAALNQIRKQIGRKK